MVLLEEQLAEIRIYIHGTPRYRETYYELYDHILNALADQEGEFNISLVEEIVKNDFGGFSQIVIDEAERQKQVTSKYKRLLWKEMMDTFKFPQVLQNVCLFIVCYMFYQTSRSNEFNLKQMQIAIFVSLLIPGLLYLIKRLIIDRKRYKISIKYDFLNQSWFIGSIVWNGIFPLLVNRNSLFDISHSTKALILVTSFFVTSIYLRSSIKLYKKEIKIFAF